MTPEELGRLADKYAALGDLRRAQARGEAPPSPRVFRELAQRFPGCLRELSTLPIEAIDARRAALERAASGGPVEPWVQWLAGYHDAVREALAGKQRDRSPRDPGAPRIRVNDAVFAALERAHGVPAAEIERAIFARSRR